MRNPVPLPFSPRNIVLLSDGTGNSAAKLFKTNVWRVYDALDLNCSDQVAFYDDGVGTAAFKPLALMGGAFGFGLKRNVLDLYMFLCRTYRVCEDGQHDRIFAFGFSRGAFTARVVCALVAQEGLVQAEDDDELRRLATWAYRRYRASRYRHSWGVKLLRGLRNVMARAYEWRKPRYEKARKIHPEIDFLGVWDTVAAYGLPIDELTRGWDRWIWPMLPNSRELPEAVKRACHAVALDDERQTFFPLLWNERNEKNGNATAATLDEERISQVWFAGVHSNIGGGYPDDSLSYTPLRWLAIEAARKGLRFIPSLCDKQHHIPAAWIERSVACAPKNDSRRGVGAYYRYHPRPVERLCRDKDADVDIARPKIHESVFARLRDSLDDYATIVLPPRYAVVTASRQILDGDADALPAQARATANPYEHSTQALSRRHLQEAAHDLVWKRRVLYFATVGVTLLAVLLPFIGLPGVDGRIHTLSAIVGMAGGMLPGFASTWVDYYSRYSVQFLLVAGAISLMLWRSGRLEQRLRTRMRAIWQESGLSATKASAVAELPSTRIYRLRTSPAYVGGFKFFSRSVWPNLFGVAMAVLIAFVLPVRLGFEAASRASWLPSSNCVAPALDAFDLDAMREGVASGGTNGTGRSLRQELRNALSRSRADIQPLKASTDPAGTFAFWPHMTCNATGVYAEEGQSYRVEIALPTAPCAADETTTAPTERRTGRWTDRYTPVDPAAPGFSTLDRLKSGWNGLVFASAQPVRRVLYADWFAPIAAIGTSLPERHVLTSSAHAIAATASTTASASASAPASAPDSAAATAPPSASASATTPATTPATAGASTTLAAALVPATIVHDFTAGRSGPITLFVNDAIAPCWRWDCFYANNAGGPARVRITRLDDDGRPIVANGTADAGAPGGLPPLTPYTCATQEALRANLPDGRRGKGKTVATTRR